MSTSPSWFDQEKFTRLVKKVGPKATSAAPASTGATRPPPPRPPEKETRRLQRSLEGADRPATSALPAPPIRAATSALPEVPIRAATSSLPDSPIRATPLEESTGDAEGSTSNFPPPMPLPELRSVSPLSRRTTPLPDLKPIFEYEKTSARPAAQSQPLPGRAHLTPMPPAIVPDEPEDDATEPDASEPSGGKADLTQFPGPGAVTPDRFPSPWQSFSPLEEMSGKSETTATPGEVSDDVEQLKKERDEALAEAELLRTQLQQADEILQATGSTGVNEDELNRTIGERDNARRDYANLREDFENLKKEQAKSRSQALPAPPAAPWSFATPGKGEDVSALKDTISGLENSVATLKRELDAMQKQISQSRDETSVAQRGLALSQKALQETRDALREASEGFSTTKANVESLKNECSSLVQQNLTLQSQNDQISHELSLAKSKLVSRS